jgi:4-hydroxybenzoate polyprenyltransferase
VTWVLNSPAEENPGLGARVRAKVAIFLELVKFEHSIFALPYAFIGAIYGAASFGASSQWVTDRGWPTWMALVWVTVAMVGARSFAFVVNRAADKEIDARNPRTAGRAVPAGLVKAWELWLFSAIVLAAFLFAVWQLDPITRMLWPFVLVAFLVYPYTKRFTWLCHYWLGLCLGLAPVGAWVAVTGVVSDPAPWVFGGAVMLWTAGFDIIYATQDVECDIRDGVHSVPADLGVAQGLIQTRIAHAATVILLVAGGLLVSAGWPLFAAVALAAVLLAYENMIISADDLSRVNAAFFTTNGIIAVIILIGTFADRLLIQS